MIISNTKQYLLKSFKGNDLMLRFKTSLSRLIRKHSLISSLMLLVPEAKMLK